jgi:hypothetical protein
MTRATTGQVARAGAVGAVGLGVVVALLQGLQSVAGSFNPRWQVTALFVLAGICASLLVQRLAARSAEAHAEADRRDLLRANLRAWPLPRLAEAHADKLGVFPARRGLEDGPYAERDQDGPLRDALERSPVVLVVGLARAGKSRTAFEVARQALPGVRTVVPRDADGLRSALEHEPSRDCEHDEIMLWLDGLERYLEALDGETLDALVEGRARVVATVRTQTWERLLAGDGRDAEAAKAVAARARVYELSATLGPEEQARAQRLYPGHDLSRGLGPALATTGRESLKPPARQQPRPREPPSRPGAAHRDLLLVPPATLGAAAVLAIALLAVIGEFDKPRPPTIADQAQEARRAGSAGPRQVVAAERADFHGSGDQSYFFAFGDEEDLPVARARSDELQVFDKRGDELVRAFRFEPRPLGAGREALLFQFRFIGDIDGDGADELVGGYGTPAIRGELLLPFAVDWDEDAGRYRVVSLAPKAPSLETRTRSQDVAGLRAAYASRLRLRDAEGREGLSGYRAQDFAVTTDPHRLISAYVAGIRRGGDERRVELQSFTFRRTGGRPELTRCRLLDGGPLTARAPTSKARPLYAVTQEAWLKASRNRFCVTFR